MVHKVHHSIAHHPGLGMTRLEIPFHTCTERDLRNEVSKYIKEGTNNSQSFRRVVLNGSERQVQTGAERITVI